MNKMLANGLAAMNAAVAFVLIAGGALFGFVSGGPVGLLAGFLVAGLFAVVLCGILALFIEMHAELILIREALSRSSPQ